MYFFCIAKPEIFWFDSYLPSYFRCCGEIFAKCWWPVSRVWLCVHKWRTEGTRSRCLKPGPANSFRPKPGPSFLTKKRCLPTLSYADSFFNLCLSRHGRYLPVINFIDQVQDPLAPSFGWAVLVGVLRTWTLLGRLRLWLWLRPRLWRLLILKALSHEMGGV